MFCLWHNPKQTEKNTDCTYDYLEIYDGDSTSATKIGQFCENPGDIKSSGNQLYVKFISDIVTQKSGVSAYFMSCKLNLL